MRRVLAQLTMLTGIFLLLSATAQAETKCMDNYSQRLTFINNFPEDAYIILTPPSDSTNTELWGSVGGGFKDLGTKDNQSMTIIGKYDANGVTNKVELCIPDKGIFSGKFKFYLGCKPQTDKDKPEYPQDCKIGVPPGHNPFGIDSIFEFTGGCDTGHVTAGNCTLNPSNNHEDRNEADYLDLSNLDGYTIPLKLETTSSDDHACNLKSLIAITDLYSCPNEDSTSIYNDKYQNKQLDAGISLVYYSDKAKNLRLACMSPERWIEPPGGQDPVNTDPIVISAGITKTQPNLADWYACNVKPYDGADADPDQCLTPGCGGPQCAVGPAGTPGVYDADSIAKGKGRPYTNFVKMLKATGNQAYAWQFNDDASTMLCQKFGAKYLVTLGPGEQGQTPYKPQKWAYAHGACNVSSTGDSDSLIECQKKHMQFYCGTEDVEKKKPGGGSVKTTLRYCKPVAQPPQGDQNLWDAAVSFDDCNKTCQSTGTVTKGL
ncbi:hypothetical protein DFW101_1046 [Solidesulfovibrio carbinoliphilus subsp. oakridgensis]|uniref:Thaumatin pathogenesis-related protein n=1 Tax=Solidesulfovibrio carbinoliphilus subsp. oakridgensis TaxID=694327 RepID=G7Q642_9BACT|nr:hypothetical protein [Solidesulfovibrio carbinoliphilus]EHJ47058.1 hypothetical protein DFW101_1046 [Solidesulfovibrio carbinoliphilus subsp. oakridgensis]